MKESGDLKKGYCRPVLKVWGAKQDHFPNLR